MTVVDISTAPATRRHIVAVAGELDMSTVPELRSCLRELEGDITLDCADVTFIDSVGIQLFIETHQRLTGMGARFALAKTLAALAMPHEDILAQVDSALVVAKQLPDRGSFATEIEAWRRDQKL